MITRVTTESGAVYEFADGKVRRVNESHEKRGDGEWQKLVNINAPIETGKRMVLTLESLSRYGSDDEGTAPEDASPFTTRTTTRVRSIDENV